MPKKQSRNYTIKYNFSMGKENIKKIMEDNFLKYFHSSKVNNCTLYK